MSDNPFSEPADSDRTVIRPMPGGRRPAAPPAQAPPGPQAPRPAGRLPAAPPPPAAAPAPAAERAALPELPADPNASPAVSVSPLTAAASRLLQLMIQLRGTYRQPDPQQLRERVMRELRDFERRGREGGIAMELLRPAHYALCASIDDIVLNTPWGAASGWSAQPLVAAFHHGARGTDQFFDQLRQMRQQPDKYMPVIELMYLCLSLGFMGRYPRAEAEDGGELARLRADTYAVIAAARNADQDLSPRWRGIDAPHRASRRVPAWVATAGAIAICGGLFFWVSVGLNAASDNLQAQALSAPPAHMPHVTRAAVVQPLPPPPAPPEPSVVDKLRAEFKPDIDRHVMSVLGTAATPILRIADHAVFAPGSAAVQQAAVPLLQRIGAALKDQQGSLSVLAYTDNRPIRTARFPSNFQLSTARAEAVRTVIAHALGDVGRVTAEGRADADPVAPNTTAEGREQNRRIDIVLHRQDSL
ncbi:MAG: type VI secretion system protein TssL, long form [Alphaproteobacteria bacterium]|nr:type VI secretion system protein TssL, long form [Alphaproteobacteria bacterium]